MRTARELLPDGTIGRTVSAEEIGPDPEPFRRPLICDLCMTGVLPVRGYKTVPSLFRLGSGLQHEAGCDLNPTEVIDSIARDSHGLAHVDQGILRLELPSDLSGAPGPDEPTGTGPDSVVRTRNITTVRPKLPPAITSAAKIARFLQMHGFDPKIVKKFKVRPHGHPPVPWGEFCYGPDNDSLAALYVRQLSAPAASHPVAVHGTVQAVRTDNGGRQYVTLATDVPAQQGRFHVVLRSMYENLITPLTPGTHVLALGDWSVLTRSHIPQLRLFADAHWQIAYWNDDEATGRPTTPTCPPPVTARQRAAVTNPKPAAKQPAPVQPPAAPSPPKRPATPYPDNTDRVIKAVLAPPPPLTPAPTHAPPPVPPQAQHPTPPPVPAPAPAPVEPDEVFILPKPAGPPPPVPPQRRKGLLRWLGRRR